MTMININLLPDELRGQKTGGGGGIDPDAIVPLGAGLLAAIVIALIPTAISLFYLDDWEARTLQAKTDVEAEIQKFEGTLSELERIGKQKESLALQYNNLQSVAGATPSWGDRLNELRNLTPANLWYSGFKVSDPAGDIAISGLALDFEAVAYLQRNLDASTHFESPVLKSTKNTDGMVSFEMTARMRTQQKKS
jgi:Tfp pilus assembly protein PilN